MCPETIIKTLIALFFAITFLQSGIDKALNRDANLGWFKSVFETTFLGRWIAPLFYWITFQEIALGIVMIIVALCNCFGICVNCFATEWGYVLCIFVLLQMFVGQRIAKDYVGAAGIIPYILVAIAGYVYFTGCCVGDASTCMVK